LRMPAASHWHLDSRSTKQGAASAASRSGGACTLNEVEGAPRSLRASRSCTCLDEADCERIAERGERMCPVSNALRGKAEISVWRELERS
jgi:organic hydroperoxide reductase OsmC/OhrA